jgi:hypothetical protein
MSGGGNGGSSTTTQGGTLPNWLMPAYQGTLGTDQQLQGMGLNATAGTGSTLLSGGMNSIAGVNPQSIGASDNLLTSDLGSGSMLGQEANGSLMNPNSNPYLAGTFRNAANGVQNQIASEFAGNGRNVTASMPVQTDAMNNLANQIYGGAYNTDLAATQNAQGQQLSAASLAPGVTQGLYTPGQQQLQAGQTPFNIQSWYQGLLGQTAAPFAAQTGGTSKELGTLGTIGSIFNLL